MVLRNVHTTLTEDYQMPSWVSYVAFAISTIVLGGILGLLLVCCIDCVYPPARPKPDEGIRVVMREDKKESDKEEEDDLPDDDGSQDEGSQDEGEDTQEENLSQDEEEEGSQAEGSQGEESQGEENFRAENKTRRRRARKAD